MAVQSKFLAAGAIVPWAEPGGAVATQAWANPRYGPDGLALLRQGLDAEAVVAQLTAADTGRADRQLGVVDAKGGSATFTGAGCMDWAGGRTGPGYAAQGNILVSADDGGRAGGDVRGDGSGPLAERLLACLAAAQAAGGDRRGQQAAGLLVVEKDAGYGGMSDVIVDLRVDEHPRPVDELQRIYGMHTLLFGKTPAEEWLPLEGELAAEVAAALARLGYASLADWAGVENLEERLGDDPGLIDPVAARGTCGTSA